MSELHVPEPTRRRRATFADDCEVDAFVEMLRRFERGEMDADRWRAYRVLNGAYSQRQDGVHMLRIKIPQGIADAEQLRALAGVAADYSRGFGHITTRQNFQLHFVRPAHLEPALRRLAAAGITTAGAGGNTVRNVVACPFAGIAEDEPFDVTPYAEAVTRHFLRHPLASSLPRKFKIAFEGCRDDHVATAIHDLGFRARMRTEAGIATRGFSVTVAGGTASSCTSGASLFEFLHASEVLTVVEAVVRIFHARGDRQNKHRNRLKFLVQQLGFEPFRALVEGHLAKVRNEGAPRLALEPDGAAQEQPPAHAAPPPPAPGEIAARVMAALPRGPGQPPTVLPDLAPGPGALDAFRTTNVRPQRQVGFSVVTVAPPQGDLASGQLEALADLSLAYGDGSVRFTNRGHVLLRWIRTHQVPALFERLAAAGLGRAGAGTAADVVSCPGSEACRAAVTHTRGVARLVEQHVRARLDGDALATPVPVHVSGCPNGCSQHHLAAIGLQGSARKLGSGVVPQYFVLVGGGAKDGGARFAKLAGKVPARRVPEAVERLVALYLSERRDGERAAEFFARAVDRARRVIAKLGELRVEDARAEDFLEPESPEAFRPETEEGECAA